MDKKFRILITDRNPNVRKFLQRELLGEGYQVSLAGESRELIQLFNSEDPPDLLILDPDIPSDINKTELVNLLHFLHPAVPIVIHTFLGDDFNYLEIPGVATYLEKGEDTDLLKKVVAEVIQK